MTLDQILADAETALANMQTFVEGLRAELNPPAAAPEVAPAPEAQEAEAQAEAAPVSVDAAVDPTPAETAPEIPSNPT